MNTKQYYYLSTIAEYGNLSYAADALGLSPSALSKFLGECERTFGFALFLRYGRRLYPTAVGRYVVECAQKILDDPHFISPYLVQKGDELIIPYKQMFDGNSSGLDF